MTPLLRSAEGAIKLYGEGLSHKAVAYSMTISPTTVLDYPRCFSRTRSEV
ncbi:hypothetical protein [Paraburkholderia sp. BL27I4N3]|nr:hypothetical protein [Paraburkholderia sp. BL27I4N3]